MRDQDDTLQPAEFDRDEAAADAASPETSVTPARTPEETLEALRACLAANHANTLAYLACLKACAGDPCPYREVEEELLAAPAFDISSQTPHTLLGFLIQDGGIERIDVAPEPEAQGAADSEPANSASPTSLATPATTAQAAPAQDDAVAGPAMVDSAAPAPSPAAPTADASQPIDYLLRTTPEGRAILAEFDSVSRFERLLTSEPEGYLDAYLVVLDTCADDGASLKEVEAALAGNPALTNPKRVYAGYFISKLEHVGAIAWSDAWHTTEDGQRIVAALAA